MPEKISSLCIWDRTGICLEDFKLSCALAGLNEYSAPNGDEAGADMIQCKKIASGHRGDHHDKDRILMAAAPACEQ